MEAGTDAEIWKCKKVGVAENLGKRRTKSNQWKMQECEYFKAQTENIVFT